MTDEQSAELSQPGIGTFNNPALLGDSISGSFTVASALGDDFNSNSPPECSLVQLHS
jgi:hypothetical protein